MTDIEKIDEFVFYNSEDGSVKVQVLIDKESSTIWANQKAIAELFGCTVPNVSYHFRNIFASSELDRDAVIKEILIPTHRRVKGQVPDPPLQQYIEW